MPSIPALLMREQLRLLKPLTAKSTVETQRKAQDMAGELGARANAAHVLFTPVSFEKFAGAWVQPKEGDRPTEAILYLHGGAYVAGGLPYAQGFGSLLAAHTGRRVLCAAYRLAPENPFPDALEDALTAYRQVLEEGYLPAQIALLGESAGGGLVFALLARLQQLEMPLPSAAVGISPWCDLTFASASYRTNEKTDPTLDEQMLRRSAFAYARETPENPLVSPVFSDPTGFPRTLLFAGGDELLLDDARRLAVLLAEHSVPCRLHVEAGMWHAYPLFSCPESTAALQMMVDFLSEREPRE